MNTPNLRAVARAQRWQIVALLWVIVSVFAYEGSDPVYEILPPFMSPTVMKEILYASIVGIWIASLVLAWQIYTGASFVLACVTCTMPPINLIAWIVINSHATKVLRAAGAKVGFFGAKASSLPPG